MSWLVRWDNVEMSSDDFLIEDLESVEKATGVPWSVANPLREIKVARAFLAVALLRAGKSESEVAAALGKVTLGTLKTAFDYKPDDQATEGGAPLAPRDHLAKTSPDSSRGRRPRAGHPAKPVGNESATSS